MRRLPHFGIYEEVFAMRRQVEGFHPCSRGEIPAFLVVAVKKARTGDFGGGYDLAVRLENASLDPFGRRKFVVKAPQLRG